MFEFKLMDSSGFSIHQLDWVQYIRDAIEILAQYEWIYNVRNTDIFIHDVLEKIPNEWIDALNALHWKELSQLPFGLIKDHWPASLKTFINQCNQLGHMRFPKTHLQSVDKKNTEQSTCRMDKNTPLKKQVEVKIMSHLIYKICIDTSCNTVLDIGSGLGYLDQILHHQYGLLCVGLDSRPKLTDGAKRRLEGDPCYNAMHHETVCIENTDMCLEKLKIVLRNTHNLNINCCCKEPTFSEESGQLSKPVSVVMAGLHCCGNLMQDMMKLFCSMIELKAFVCIGCCYNKIDKNDFPMSKTAQNLIDVARINHPNWYPCTSGLRLASHATKSEWASLDMETLLYREKALIYRAVLQYYLCKENISWHKPKRRMRQTDLAEFKTYCENMFNDDSQIWSEKASKERLKKLSIMYGKKEHLFPRVRILLILQVLLQPIWEMFVTIDRMLYFDEHSIVTEAYAAWDDALSPRNIALCGYKR